MISKEVQNFVATAIPAEDDPNLFGLPVNIKFSWELTEAEHTIARMRMAVTTSAGHERSSWAETCNPILQLWKRLCQGSDLHNRQLPIPKESSDPIAEVLSLEFVHALKVGILLQGAIFDGQLRSTLVSSPPVTNAPQLTLGWMETVIAAHF
ncbi:hypothetical protein OESDEN_02807 [Oesophagostomum dentatum]|uniref:Uncharacterized protein n=1 Tax=Oesophagostomum dentatum TaxID=61180 RepID=A0A0B1TI55_OESDE|nr:hypothetical protein OESDEN_02807 [Oesophagostomum dentatum]